MIWISHMNRKREKAVFVNKPRNVQISNMYQSGFWEVPLWTPDPSCFICKTENQEKNFSIIAAFIIFIERLLWFSWAK